MIIVFADAGYWIAMINPLEILHLKAKAISRNLGKTKIITTELILVELLNFYAAGGAHARALAVRYVAQIRQNSFVEIVSMDESLFTRGYKLYASRLDKEWGMVDCVSFSVMQERGLFDALAYDHHFQQAGYRALLRDA